MTEGPYCKKSYDHVPKVVKQRKMALAEHELTKFTLRCKNRIVKMWDEDLIDFKNGAFYYIETKKPVEGIVYKKKYREGGDDADDMFGDDDEDDDDFEDVKEETRENKAGGGISEVKELTAENEIKGVKISF